jgi:hypothetical protein
MTYSENHLWPLIIKAYQEARRSKRKTHDEQAFEINALANLIALKNDIQNRTYHPSPGIAFVITSPVSREIFAAPFRDRIVHHLIFNLVYEWWDKRLIFDSYSCRTGKGTLKGIKRISHFIASASQNHTRPAYILKLDLQGYFMSLPRHRLFEAIMYGVDRQFAKDSWEHNLLQFLLHQIIFDDPTKNVKIRGRRKPNIPSPLHPCDAYYDWDILPHPKTLFYAQQGCGIVIGNLTSQLLSNIYLDKLDRFILHSLKIKHYGRYVDDFLIISSSKATLIALIPEITAFLTSIGLTLHPQKRYLQESSKGVDFIGARIFPHRLHPSHRTTHNFQSALHSKDPAHRKATITSYTGLLKHYKHKKLLFKFSTKPYII